MLSTVCFVDNGTKATARGTWFNFDPSADALKLDHEAANKGIVTYEDVIYHWA